MRLQVPPRWRHGIGQNARLDPIPTSLPSQRSGVPDLALISVANNGVLHGPIVAPGYSGSLASSVAPIDFNFVCAKRGAPVPAAAARDADNLTHVVQRSLDNAAVLLEREKDVALPRENESATP